MKSSFLAFLLNFFLPGAGLAYLGKWRWAFINLGVVLLIGLIAALILANASMSEEYLRYVAFGCAGGSGGFAQALAKQMNQRAKPDEASP